MPLELRDYQQDVISWLYNSQNALVQLETGSGKTVLAAEFIRQQLEEEAKVAVILPKTYLIRQWLGAFYMAGIGDDLIGVMTSSGCTNPYADVMLCATDRMAYQLHPVFDLIFIDEAHRSVAPILFKEIRRLNPSQLVGLTATPCRTDGQGLGILYNELYKGPTYTQLQDAGHLAPLEYYAADKLLLTYQDTLGYREKQLNEASVRVERGVLASSVWDAWERYCKGNGPTIVFAASLDHAQTLTDQFRQRGLRAGYIDGKVTGSKRDCLLADFKSGLIDVVTNYGVLVEGFDAPGACNAITARATGSLIFHRQTVGRILRPEPGKVARYIDLVDNWQRLATPELNIDWTLDGIDLSQYQTKSLVRVKDGRVIGRDRLEVVVRERDLDEIDVTSLPPEWRGIWGQVLSGSVPVLELIAQCLAIGNIPQVIIYALAYKALKEFKAFINEASNPNESITKDAYQGIMPDHQVIRFIERVSALSLETTDAPWKLPEAPGIYIALDCKAVAHPVLYVGESVSLRSRWWRPAHNYVHPTVYGERGIDDPRKLGIAYCRYTGPQDIRWALERMLINILNPALNIQ